jgi:hypothetical protein
MNKGNKTKNRQQQMKFCKQQQYKKGIQKKTVTITAISKETTITCHC